MRPHRTFLRFLFLQILLGSIANVYAAIEPIVLPIEVIGEDNHIESVEFNLDAKISKPDKIYLRVNNLSYNGKMHVKLNAGKWIKVSNGKKDIQIFSPDRNYGGIGGGFSTIRLCVDVDDEDFDEGSNKIFFSFNYSKDPYTGSIISAGYRIIDFNILNHEGSKMISKELFVHDDPKLWKPPYSDDLSHMKGEQLWSNADLTDPNGTKLKAKCADCHAQDGRDLKYFNYSNKSIVARAMFHGLSREEGLQIATYIRNYDLKPPENARPWNPPYQPGPGTKERGVFAWAAGAGLDAVLRNDGDMLSQMFGTNDLSNEIIDSITNTKADLDLKEIGVAVQFPDWKHWLPRTHPKDMWNDWQKQTPLAISYDWLVNQFENHNLAKKDSLIDLIHFFQYRVGNWLFSDRDKSKSGDQNHWWTSRTGQPFESVVNKRYFTPERVKWNLTLWQSVKLWELIHKYDAEDKAKDIVPEADEFNWPTNLFTVFTAAAHFIGDDRGTSNFEWERKMSNNINGTIGVYWSSIWYELQMVLSSGMRQGGNVDPVDWAYNMQHINLLSYASGIYEPLRLFRNIIKTWQQRDHGRPIGMDGWTMREVSPWRVYGDFNGKTKVHQHLDNYAPNLRLKLTNSMLKYWLIKVNTYEPDDWPRTDVINYEKWPQLEIEDYDPTGKANPWNYFITSNGSRDAIEANAFWRIIPKFQQMGVSPDIVSGLAVWANSVWTNPNTNWEQWIK